MSIREEIDFLFQYKRSQIAFNDREVNAETRVFIGGLFKGIFIDYPNLEHIYLEFPSKKIRRIQITIGGIDIKSIKQKLKKREIRISDQAWKLIDTTNTLTKKQEISLFVLHVGRSMVWSCMNLETAISRFYSQARDYGLDICAREDLLHLLLSEQFYPSSSDGDIWLSTDDLKIINMRMQNVFKFGRGCSDVFLCSTSEGNPGDQPSSILFRLPQNSKIYNK